MVGCAVQGLPEAAVGALDKAPGRPVCLADGAALPRGRRRVSAAGRRCSGGAAGSSWWAQGKAPRKTPRGAGDIDVLDVAQAPGMRAVALSPETLLAKRRRPADGRFCRLRQAG